MAFGSEQWMYNAGGGFYPHEIDNSARLDTNAYFQRTPSSAGNRKTFTWSGWVKREEINRPGSQTLFQQRADSNNSQQLSIQFRANDIIRVIEQTSGGGTTYLLNTNAVFRDPSAWYHIVVAYDTTNSTAGDRVRLYVNGERQTSFSTANTWPLNNDSSVNTTDRILIGASRPNSSSTISQYFNGYMAEVNFVDGQALDPTDFGEFKSGVWIPKSYSGTYGTNGFYLDFATRATDPIDASGNGNNWGSVNVVSTDWMLDSPTNNFATLNPLEVANGTFAEGNLKFSAGAAGHQMASSSLATSFNSGKWYAEILISAVGGTYPHIGITPVNTSNATYVGNNGYGYRSDGQKQILNSTSSYGASYASGDIIGVAFDADSGSITFYKNGTSQGVASSSVDTGTSWRISNSLNSTGGISLFNFGQDSSFAGNKTAQGNTDANGIGDFYYAPPAGYLALCSANLPETAIDPAEDDIPADYFNPVLYTGNSSTQSITGVGFQPDWVWIKERSSTSGHFLYDQVRGPQKGLNSHNTNAEGTSSSQLTSFDSDGFTTGASGGTNESGQTYVAWNWKAGGSAVANTDGTIASQVSANTKAGFSIVTIDGLPASTLSTFGHGLGVKPDMVILKSRNNTTNWEVYHSSLTPDGERKLYLNATSAEIDSAFMGDTPPTSSVVSFNPGSSASNHVAYCFHSVEGFSKFGSYTGNGSADGTFVYTGFRPAYVIVKRTDAANDWPIQDNARNDFNVVDKTVYADLANSESDLDRMDFVSNGFKLRNTYAENNASGGTYIYMAFAEMPFKYANAR